jgi:hypothetical protein
MNFLVFKNVFKCFFLIFVLWIQKGKGFKNILKKVLFQVLSLAKNFQTEENEKIS